MQRKASKCVRRRRLRLDKRLYAMALALRQIFRVHIHADDRLQKAFH